MNQTDPAYLELLYTQLDICKQKQKNKQNNGWIDGQASWQTVKQIEVTHNRQTDRTIDQTANRQADRQTGQTDRIIDRKMDGWMEMDFS